MHCKTRNMKIVEIRTNDRWNNGPMLADAPIPAGDRTTIVATDGDSYVTLSVKTENVGKFPTVGQSVPVDIYFNKEATA